MSKRDPLETLRQMLEFAQEACQLAQQGSREALDTDIGFRRHAERVAELIGEDEETPGRWLAKDWVAC